MTQSHMSLLGADDQQSLLESDHHHHRDQLNTFKLFVSDVLKNHLKVFIAVCDVFCVITFTSVILIVNAWNCVDSAVGEDQELSWCEPYKPVDKVIVDLSFDLLVHCDSPKSCVAWAELQGGQYNFILGDEELVYVGRGYQCEGGGVLKLQMLVTRFTWDPSQPAYRIPHEVALR
ncbi:uncharacterized protein LOC128982677 [Macrosteles quadrilineatus]|uniref:uncharacterized protein LOC128982677 n=1 Tax=Macrosteles quadrilineatus TaxID=74068 RepID=UPI0023E0F16A|nr:uncharacterized protein LOC128982677 [Macrosteles quadrilineatus]